MSSNLANLDHFRDLRLPDAKAEYLRQLDDLSIDALSFEERISLILERETQARRNRRIARRIKDASLKVAAYKEEFSFESNRGISKSEFANLMSLSWVRGAHNAIITGASGTGKTYMACLIGTEAARGDLTVRYHRTSDLIERLSMARADGSYRSFSAFYKKLDLLLLDDFGLSPLSIMACRELLDILDDRVQNCSTVIASQYPVEVWHKILDDKTAADAILDRLAHDSHQINLIGESMRKVRANKA